MLFVDMPRGIATVDPAHRSYCWAVNALTMADFNAPAVAMSAHAYSIVKMDTFCLSASRTAWSASSVTGRCSGRPISPPIPAATASVNYFDLKNPDRPVGGGTVGR